MTVGVHGDGSSFSSDCADSVSARIDVASFPNSRGSSFLPGLSRSARETATAMTAGFDARALTLLIVALAQMLDGLRVRFLAEEGV